MFINPYLLSEPSLYCLLTKMLPNILIGSASFDKEPVRHISYCSWHKKNFHHSDQMFHSHWDQLMKRKAEEGSLSRALLGQVARYHFEPNNSRLAIRMERFDEWQSWISNQSGLPVIAYQAEKLFHNEQTPVECYLWLKSKLGFRSLISPYHPMIEDYIERIGLNDIHMHLNGTTSLEAMWNFALNNSERMYKDLLLELENRRVQLLYALYPELNHPKKYEELLLFARKIRQLLIAFTQSPNSINQCKESIVNFLSSTSGDSFTSIGIQLEKKHFDCEWPHLAEGVLHLNVLRKLKNDPSDTLDICYLIYILCMNCFQGLMVQRNDQFGFDQFQKFADDGIREEFEKHYSNRFFQLHGPNLTGRPDLLTLEGRFAPKKTLEKNELLVTEILRGFLAYANGRKNNLPLEMGYDLDLLTQEVLSFKRPTLRLVCHFIKKSWDFKKESHFKSLRYELINNANQLFFLLDKYKNLKSLITGVDAAANELEAPPEVFSVLYRKCRSQGLNHATFHVGEDFEHLLTGIRSVFDAVTLLDLRTGDRLGHATSIGIDPQYWLNVIPEILFISKGKRLEDLLFLRYIALNKPELLLPLAHIDSEITTLAMDIFHDEDYSLDILQDFFFGRGLEPNVVKNIVNSSSTNQPYVGWLYEEYKIARNINKKSLKILAKRWFDRETIERYEEKKEFTVKKSDFSILLKAQQYVQSIIYKKQIILEALPTSNVRISHYHSIKQHHIFRWLQIPQASFDGDFPVLVSLGTDDPGIFATDMRNEVYHLFSTLKFAYEYPDSKAMEIISELNENGRIYRFTNDTYPLNSEGLAER